MGKFKELDIQIQTSEITMGADPNDLDTDYTEFDIAFEQIDDEIMDWNDLTEFNITEECLLQYDKKMLESLLKDRFWALADRLYSLHYKKELSYFYHNVDFFMPIQILEKVCILHKNEEKQTFEEKGRKHYLFEFKEMVDVIYTMLQHVNKNKQNSADVKTFVINLLKYLRIGCIVSHV